MPKESRKTHRRRHKHVKPGRDISEQQYLVRKVSDTQLRIIRDCRERCRELAESIRSQFDDIETSLTTVGNHVQKRIEEIDQRVNRLKESRYKRFTKDDSKKLIDEIMLSSSGCQLQLLEVSLQCPLSKAKIKVPIKTQHCQHLGCFDAESFLSLMAKRDQDLRCPRCPICSASGYDYELLFDEFLQEIIDTTSPEAMKIEFTSSTQWRIKKETGTPISSKSKPKHDFIDLTYSPALNAVKNKSFSKSNFIDLTLSP